MLDSFIYSAILLLVSSSAFFLFMVEFSISTFSSLILLLSLLVSPSSSCMSFLTTSLYLSFGVSYLTVSTHFPCSHYYIFLSLSIHRPNHLSLDSLMFSLMFATPAIALISSVLIFSVLFIPIIHLNILGLLLAALT